jgi:Protein of unknown function (DUF3987)
MTFNFIDYYVDYTEQMESPTDFFRWSALAALAAVARDNVYLQSAHLTVYPNIFVILFARSGTARKTMPMRTVKPFILNVGNTHVITGRTSMQSVVQELSMSFTDKRTGDICKGASGLLYAEELSSFIVADPAAIPLLTDLADFHEDWSNATISREKDKLKNVCLTMLAGSNEVMLREIFNRTAMLGGLLGRVFLIYAEKARSKNALVREQAVISSLPLQRHLENLAKLKGACRFTDEAADYFEKWYMETDFDKSDSQTGLEARIPTNVKKIAMLLRLAESPLGLDVELHHVTTAIEMVMSLVPTYRSLIAGSSNSDIGKLTAAILNYLMRTTINGKPATRAAIAQEFWNEGDNETINKALSVLALTNYVEERGQGGVTTYRVTQLAIEKFTRQKPA